MRVLLVSGGNIQCGIREHSEMLVAAMHARKAPIEHTIVGPENPTVDPSGYDVLVVDHHAALHAAWTLEILREFSNKVPTVVIQHDTFEQRSIMIERGLPDFVGAVHALVVHEPVEGLSTARGKAALHRSKLPPADPPFVSTEVYYLPQGIPDIKFGAKPCYDLPTDRPFVGTVGFPFPWKNYPLLIGLAAHAGWGVLIYAPGMADAELAELATHAGADQPLHIVTDWLPRADIVAGLRQCAATAFLYQNGNSGTSAAIRLGLAAGQPVLAFPCRQFNDLLTDSLGQVAVAWCWNGETDFLGALQTLDSRVEDDADRTCAHWREKIAVLRQRDSWASCAETLAGIYMRVIKRKAGTL